MSLFHSTFKIAAAALSVEIEARTEAEENELMRQIRPKAQFV